MTRYDLTATFRCECADDGEWVRYEDVEQMERERDACLALLREVVEKALPDSEFYRWLWDECTNEEQDYVKDIRGRIMALLAAHGEPRKEETR